MTARCAACGLDVYDGGELCPICQSDPPPGYAENDSGAGGRTPTGNGTKHPATELARRAEAAIRKHGGVRAAGRALDCNHGIIGLAAKGQDFPAARKVLGLPPKTVTVEPCPDCGHVHEQLHTCPDELERQRQGPKRIRSHVEHGYGDAGRRHKERVRAWLEAHGWGSLTEAVDEIMEVE